MDKKKMAAARSAAQTYQTIRTRLPKTWWGTVLAVALAAATGAVMLLSGCAAAPLMAPKLLPKPPALNVEARGEANVRLELEANQASEIQLREQRVRSELRIREWQDEAEARARARASGASASASSAGACPTCQPCPDCPSAAASAAAAASAGGVKVELPVDHAVNALCEGIDKGCGPAYQCHAELYEAGATAGSIYNVDANFWFVPTGKTNETGRPVWMRIWDKRHFPACSDESLVR